MNPIFIIGAAIVGWLLLNKKSTPAATQPGAIIKAPTATQPGSVSVSVPQLSPVLTPPIVVEIPETTITGSPPNTSLLLTAEETNTLASGSADQIYQAATNSNHATFIAAAGLVLSGRGDIRGPDVSRLATQL